jgi:hypothetical protein
MLMHQTRAVNAKNLSYYKYNGKNYKQGSSVSKISEYGLDDRFLRETENLSSNLCVQTGSGAHPASCTMGTEGKARPGRDADHSPPSSAEVKKE